MKLVFKHIEIFGFMSFENETFDFSQHPGMTLVCGKNNDIPNVKNGSGKTNLFSALLYALFGQLQDKIKNEYIVNRYSTDRDLRIMLQFSVDSTDYTIARGLKNGKLSYLELKRGDDDISKSTINETQDLLEREIIKCDISIFLRTMFLTADKNYNFYTLKKQEKKEFVEKLFDIQIFGDMYQQIHKDVLLLDKDMLARQNRLMVLNKTKSDYDQQVKMYDVKRNDRIELIKKQISETAKAYDARKAAVRDKADEKIKKLKSAREKIREAALKISSDKDKLSGMIQKYDIQLGKDETQKETRQQIINKHAGIAAKLCEKCRAVFNDHYQLDKYKNDIQVISESINKIKNEKNTKKDELAKVLKNEKKLTDAVWLLENDIKAAEDQSSKNEREIAVYEAKIEQLKLDYKKISAEHNPYCDLIRANESSISEETKKLGEISKKYKYLKFAENIVSQETLRKFIIQDLIGLLNNRIQKYLMKLGSKYTVMFDSDMDYEFVIAGGKCDFQNFSAGERMRIMVATSFAFRDFMSIRNGLMSNVLILDEYFDSAIDSACVESIISILKDYMLAYNQNIYVISHRQEVTSEMFNSVVQVEKTNNISRINYLR